ncbi:MAG: conserved repeat protein, partial [Paenibacillus sp.]|nr:conserved repeat protein [Paenibacillus sp.]
MWIKLRLRLKPVLWFLMFALWVSAFQMGPQQRAFADPVPQQLKEADQGSIVSYGNIDWILLIPATGYVIAKDLQGGKPFDPQNTNIFDPVDTNNIAYWLNDEASGFYSQLLNSPSSANGSWIVEKYWSIEPFGEALTVSSPRTAQKVKIGLLSRNEWAAYNTFIGIPGPNDVWWLRTPVNDSFQVGNIWSHGSYVSALDARLSLVEARPTLYLNPELYITDGNGVEIPYRFADATATNSAGTGLSATPSTVTADGASSSSLTVTIHDANGHPILGHSISLSQGGGNSVITAVYETTNSNGQAEFIVTNTKAETVTYTATDTTDNVTIGQTAQVAFTAGAADAAHSALIADQASLVANGTSSSTLTVTV